MLKGAIFKEKYLFFSFLKELRTQVQAFGTHAQRSGGPGGGDASIKPPSGERLRMSATAITRVGKTIKDR